MHNGCKQTNTRYYFLNIAYKLIVVLITKMNIAVYVHVNNWSHESPPFMKFIKKKNSFTIFIFVGAKKIK